MSTKTALWWTKSSAITLTFTTSGKAPNATRLPVADDQIEHPVGYPVQWCRVRCRPWPPVCPVQYRTSRRYPRRLAGAVLRDVCQCRDSDSHLPFEQSRQRRPHSRRVCVLGSSRTPCAWAMSTVFHGLIPFDCFSRFPSGEKYPPRPLTSRWGCLATSSRMSGSETTLGQWVAENVLGQLAQGDIEPKDQQAAVCGVLSRLDDTVSASWCPWGVQ